MTGMSCLITLVGEKHAIDAYQSKSETSRREVYAEQLPIYQSEFHAAKASGFDAALIVRIYSFEYQGEKTVICNDKPYEVYRVYQKNADFIELYLTAKGR